MVDTVNVASVNAANSSFVPASAAFLSMSFGRATSTSLSLSAIAPSAACRSCLVIAPNIAWDQGDIPCFRLIVLRDEHLGRGARAGHHRTCGRLVQPELRRDGAIVDVCGVADHHRTVGVELRRGGHQEPDLLLRRRGGTIVSIH
jgi:hypothetical protein